MPMNLDLDALFRHCEATESSDLHLAPGQPPYCRTKGRLAPLPDLPLTPAQLHHAALRLLSAMARTDPAAALETALARRGSIDGACTSPSGARYRFNIYRTQSPLPPPGAPAAASLPDPALPSIAIALRRLDDRFRSLDELGIPARLADCCAHRHGLVVISGPTGSGKSTTLATLIDQINRTRPGHIITIEDPVEYIHRSALSLVNQRQVGIDAPSFNDALVDSLREDPDVVLVGEIRDVATIRTAITAAETGHLVFTTLHAGDCVGAIERLVSVFPSGEQEAIRRQLSLVLRTIAVQLLLPAATPPDAPPRRVPACEILVNTPAIANLVATGKSPQIYSAIETGTSSGMQTLEQDLARLVREGAITPQTAFAVARYPDTLRSRLRIRPA